MSENSFYIPRELDAKPLIMLWEYDTAMIAIMTFLIIAMLGGAILAIISSYIAVKNWILLKENGGDGMLLRLFYWLFYSDFIVTKPQYRSEAREFIG